MHVAARRFVSAAWPGKTPLCSRAVNAEGMACHLTSTQMQCNFDFLRNKQLLLHYTVAWTILLHRLRADVIGGSEVQLVSAAR